MRKPRPLRVVIVGSGFAGLQATKVLADSGAEVVLVDRNNYHTFVPMLYQVATAFLEPQQVVYPLRRFLRRVPNARFVMAEVKRIDFENQVVETDGSAIPYDFLILATGSQSQFLGVPGAPEYTLPMKTLQEAVTLRDRILRCFEQAVQEPDPMQRDRLLTFVIVGGGPTGVELAGALIELIRGSLSDDYPTLNMQQAQVILLQSGDCLLANLPERLGDYTRKRLRQMGVKVYLQTKVRQVSPEAVYLEDGSTIFAETIIWTAGLEAALPATTQELARASKGKVVVQPTLQLSEHSQVYVVGDLAYVEQMGKPLTGVAQEAIQQGELAAKNILRQMRGRSPQPFNYINKGRLAIIGRNAGVGEIGTFTFTGVLAWFLWLYVHLCYLPGIRNRISVLFNWISSYFFRIRPAPLIFNQASIKTETLKTKVNPEDFMRYGRVKPNDQ